MTDFIYDVETYPNCFSFCAYSAGNRDIIWRFEISTRVNQTSLLLQFLWSLTPRNDDRLVGFNNEAFDYPIIHYIMQLGVAVTVEGIYQKAMSIINNYNDRFAHIIWEKDRYIEQIDLFKIHHFDNLAKSTSLKALQFAMRSESIEDLPIPPGTILTDEQMDVIARYNWHDVVETYKFYLHTLPAIRFREELSAKYGRSFMNFNDTKIGKEIFIQRLEEAQPGCCYDYSSGRKEVKQTKRDTIDIGSVILPTIWFNQPEFNRVKNYLASQLITETKGMFKDLSVTVNGFEFSFGLGGIHGSVSNRMYESDEQYVILDLDVTSYYPSVAIVNKLHPAHLGDVFCKVFKELKDERVQHKKGSTENAALKLALNGTIGDSNNPYSAFLDPAFNMSITVNGQLLVCMLAEQLMASVPSMTLIQANTDGITIHVPRADVRCVGSTCALWEEYTGMRLERVEYSRMFIRDVNNYLAEKLDGKIKRKGAYCHETPLENPNTPELQWHQDHSARVIAKAAEAYLLDGEPIGNYLRSHTNIMDFMLRAKVNRGSKLMLGDKEIQRISRYYISNTGAELYKLMPPLKGKDKERKIGINVGWLATLCNNMRKVTSLDINYDYYTKEVEKLTEIFK